MSNSVYTFEDKEVRLNEPSKVQIKGKAYEQVKGGLTEFERDFDVYLWKKGTGHPFNLLFTEPDAKIEDGQQELCLSKMDSLEEYELDDRGRYVLNQNLRDEEIEDSAYQITRPADERDVKELISDLDSEEIRNLIDEYLLGAGAVSIDETLLYTLRPYLLEYEPEAINPEQAMPLNPHALIYTNPYVGKSTTFSKIGEKYGYCSPAKVLGWSDAKKKEQGALHNLTSAFGIDELNEGGHDGGFLQRGFLPIMRDGKYQAAQGQGVETQTWSPLVFMSNPKNRSDYNLVTQFRENLSTLSDNYGALGSRLGVILYGEDFDPVNTMNGDESRAKKAGKVVKTMLQLASKKFSELVQRKEVRDWLNQDFPEEYKEEIEERTENDIPLPEVEQFWREHLKASNHTRGHAIRNAVLDHISEIVHEVYDVDKLLETADDHFSQITDTNRESLRNICSVIDTNFYEEVVKKDLENFNPKYMRFFTYGTIKTVKEEELDCSELQPLTNVREHYLENTDKFFSDDDSGQYRKYAVVKEKLENSNQSKRDALRSRTGLQLTDIQGETFWKVNDEERFDQFVEAVEI